MRLIQGRDGWWCITTSGVALVPEALVRAGRLTEPGWGELDRLGLLAPPVPDRYSLTVLTSTACNLGCPYCFQNTGPADLGRHDPPRIPRVVLEPDLIDAIVEFTRGRLADLGLRRLHVVLFGGEPLMNPSGCQQVLERCGELAEVTGTMITNGVLLDANRSSQLWAAGLRSVQVTVDGPKDLHDQVRTTRAGGPTFDRILANVAAAQQATDLRFTFRVNLTPAALDRIDDLLVRLAAAVAAERCGFGIAPVMDYGWGVDQQVEHSSHDTRRIVNAYALAQELGFRIARPGPAYCAFCSVERGRLGAVVNADGTLYSCWDAVGRVGYEVGTVASGYLEYPPERWVRCGDSARATGAPDRVASLADEVDAAVLDLIRERTRAARAAVGSEGR